MVDNLKSSGLVMSKSSNYNTWQISFFKELIFGKVLEIGSGVGNITTAIVERCEQVVCIEVNRDAIRKSKFKNMLYSKKITYMMGDFMEIEVSKLPNTINLIVMMNVLEHVENENQFMAKCKEIMISKNCPLFLLVPAHSWLFGTLDLEVGHYRRYIKQDLLKMAEEIGFRIEGLRYFNSIGALGWWVNYVLLKRKGSNEEETSSQIFYFDKLIVPWLKFFEKCVSLPFGLSLICKLEIK